MKISARTIKEVEVLVRERFIVMQNSLNQLERGIENTDEINQSSIAFHVGKIQSEFQYITNLLHIFDNK